MALNLEAVANLRRKVFRGRSNSKKPKLKRASGRSARVGRTLLVLCAILVLVLPVLLIAHPISYVPLLVAVLTVLLSGVYLQVLRRSLTMSVSQMSSSCERGQQTDLTVDIASASVLPFPRIEMEFFVTDLFGDYDDVRQLTCALGPRESSTLDFDVRFVHLGTYRAGIDHVVLHDLLGLFSSRMGDVASRSVVVRPRKVSMSSVATVLVVPDESHQMLRPVASDDTDYASVREYHYGDPLKTIHWNLTSRSPNATMYTRLYETYVNPALAIVVDSYSPDLEAEDLMSLFDGMVECAASLSEQVRQAGIDVEIRYVDREGSPATTRLASMSDADDLVMGMLRITPAAGAGANAATTETMLRAAGLQSHGFGNIALVTSRLDAGLLTALTEIRMRRRNVMLFVAVPRELEGRERESFLAPTRRLDAVGIAHYVVESTEVETKVVGL
jgi:uncharacterized protein (DUF58 family)